MKRYQLSLAAAVSVFAVAAAAGHAGQQELLPGGPRPDRHVSPPLPAHAQTFETSEHRIRVSVVTQGLSHPWGMAFLPDGGMLVTETPGRLRLIRNGTLDPKPIAGVPAVHRVALVGLMDIALHPKFAENGLVYLSYAKANDAGLATTALARGRFDDHALVDVKDIFIANTWSKSRADFGGRIAFHSDGTLYFSVGERMETARAQKPDDHGGKILRLRDDGGVPPDNPFVGQAGYDPAIYSLGHRNPQGLAIQPATGVLWETEHGPLGGDELNLIRAGHNYGWPLVTFGINYDGTKVSDLTSRADLESPLAYWVPSIGPSGLVFYSGNKFPAWRGNAFVGGMTMGRSRGTGQLQRLWFNQRGQVILREPLLVDLHQRIRSVYQGPDDLLYVLTEENNGAILKIEPAP